MFQPQRHRLLGRIDSRPVRGSPERVRRLAEGSAASSNRKLLGAQRQPQARATTTPIKHLVVIFDENISFDHYFATYPRATNTDGTSFSAAKGTPWVSTTWCRRTFTAQTTRTPIHRTRLGRSPGGHVRSEPQLSA